MEVTRTTNRTYFSLSRQEMKCTSLIILLAASFMVAPCNTEPFYMELPGYAKTVVGAYGKIFFELLTCFSFELNKLLQEI